MNSQQEKIDSTEDHVNSAAVNVGEGTKTWGKAEEYKLAALLVAGALIRGEVKGQTGLLDASKCQKLQLYLVVRCCASQVEKWYQKKKQTENDGEAHFQLSSCPQPNWPKNAVKNQTLLIIDISMFILMRTFAAEIVATDTQEGLNCDKRIYFVVCWVLVEIWET